AGGPAPDLSVPGGSGWPAALLGMLAEAGIRAPLWCVTRGAVLTADTDDGGRALDPAQAAVWGAGRVCALEQPDQWGGLVDLPDIIDANAADAFTAALAGLGEDQLAVRPSGLFARRLARVDRDPGQVSWAPTGTVLVAGAADTMAEPLIRWLAGAGAHRLVL